jgi:ketosteroid isomerase-like protein
MHDVDVEAFSAWLDRYFAAWRSNDPGEVEALFAEDAVYSWGPFREPAHGRGAIVRAWVEGGVPPGIRFAYEALATAGDRGVAHFHVGHADERGGEVEMDGILVCDFDAEGRCTLHQEWYDRVERPS